MTFCGGSPFIIMYGGVGKDDDVSVEVIGQYGIRRVYGKGFFIEPTFGLGYTSFAEALYLTANFRLGYSF